MEHDSCALMEFPANTADYGEAQRLRKKDKRSAETDDELSQGLTLTMSSTGSRPAACIKKPRNARETVTGIRVEEDGSLTEIGGPTKSSETVNRVFAKKSRTSVGSSTSTSTQSAPKPVQMNSALEFTDDLIKLLGDLTI
eukprot:TRINITY_DN18680_c0_g1_i1.p1 TRINITY_DN18680_c0_g1~~TRINITY_DN18680_c0_g1_i1.p1  ORF type:complete len:140 (+),score=27.73 TRINITY_DN18680_c0_g1_i1:69-488(+)